MLFRSPGTENSPGCERAETPANPPNMIRQPESPKTFVWRICSAHVIAYFTAGVFAMLFLDYRTHFSSESLALLMRPVSSPWVALGPGLQIFRGLLPLLLPC